MKLFDLRHKWGDPVRSGVFISRTCSVCGRTDKTETWVPDAFIEEVLSYLERPNPFRELLRTR